MSVIAALKEQEFGEFLATVRISSPSLPSNRLCRCSTGCEKTLRSPGSSTGLVDNINENGLNYRKDFRFDRNRSILYPRLCTQGMMTSSNLREETLSLQMNISFPQRRFSFDPSNG
jgi:hypothetical protein